MRTTLDIDDDVLELAKDLAASQKRTAGKVISMLVRKGYQASHPIESPKNTRNGVEMLPRRGEAISLAHVQKLLDEEGL
ncbi:MAG: antitoxin [Terrimicrobiaceae bacterium]